MASTGEGTALNARTFFALGLVRLRRILFPVALFGLVVLGLHAGSDRLDDLAFSVINALDRFADQVLAALVKGVLAPFGPSQRTVARWTYAAVSLIDLEEKRWAARMVALLFELTADVLLLWPVLRHRQDRTRWRDALPSPRSISNMGAVLAPLAVGMAGFAGAVVVAQQAQLQLFWLVRGLGRDVAGKVAGAGALIILLTVIFRLTIPGIRAGLASSRASAEHGPWWRGWPLVAPFFIAMLAMSPAPLWRTLRGLAPW